MRNNKYIDFKLIQAVTGNVYQPSVEYSQLLKENTILKEENQLWMQMYYDIVDIFKKVIPIDIKTIQNSIDKQNTLFSICRDVIKSIENQTTLIQQKVHVYKKSSKPKKQTKNSDNQDLLLKNKCEIEQSSQITNRLNNIDKTLTDEIAKNQKYLTKTNSHQKKKRSSSSHKKIKSIQQFSDLFNSDFYEQPIKKEIRTATDKISTENQAINKISQHEKQFCQQPVKKRKNDIIYENRNRLNKS